MQHELILILNSRKILLLSISLVCAIFSLSCQKQTASENSQIKEIPKDWQKIEIDYFSFSIPPTMKKNDVRGTDSPVTEFENNEIKIHIEYGDAAADLISFLQNYEGKKKQTVIDGEIVDIVSFDRSKPIYSPNKINDKEESDKVEKAEKNYVIGVKFLQKRVTNSSYPRPDILLVAIYKNSEMRETAKTILYSIKFKEK